MAWSFKRKKHYMVYVATVICFFGTMLFLNDEVESVNIESEDLALLNQDYDILNKAEIDDIVKQQDKKKAKEDLILLRISPFFTWELSEREKVLAGGKSPDQLVADYLNEQGKPGTEWMAAALQVKALSDEILSGRLTDPMEIKSEMDKMDLDDSTRGLVLNGIQWQVSNKKIAEGSLSFGEALLFEREHIEKKKVILGGGTKNFEQCDVLRRLNHLDYSDSKTGFYGFSPGDKVFQENEGVIQEQFDLCLQELDLLKEKKAKSFQDYCKSVHQLVRGLVISANSYGLEYEQTEIMLPNFAAIIEKISTDMGDNLNKPCEEGGTSVGEEIKKANADLTSLIQAPTEAGIQTYNETETVLAPEDLQQACNMANVKRVITQKLEAKPSRSSLDPNLGSTRLVNGKTFVLPDNAAGCDYVAQITEYRHGAGSGFSVSLTLNGGQRGEERSRFKVPAGSKQ